jgi:hypothetical protein
MANKRLLALLALSGLAGCGGGDESHLPDASVDGGAAIDASQADASAADASATDAGGGTPPTLACDPATTTGSALCACMADIVCDQIYYCLSAAEIAAKPPGWSPYTACVASLGEDCNEDLSDPGYLPADFPACVQDLADATCADYGDFGSVSMDFPASCDNLRALDTGLGIAL